jgi:hypothetical protein
MVVIVKLRVSLPEKYYGGRKDSEVDEKRAEMNANAV